ncbi:glycosyltransferase family 2 protein [Chelativorans salis]|uniref:Glycosyltransferase n=1 Tax=Chelativorans salis TaxID=2978478 RepID=A0ABT2LHE1_9HYPH|nr:glycosyltransferase family 2 protein [Chelativorans sp. EGI FJ00035]MCT7373975.1 glycosyltransferase [Chelativorans sp. EGI FJ00035]
MSAPLVSVLLPVYNAEPYLAAALESVLRQDYERLEIIAIDDGSTDRSAYILRQYQKADGRISIVSRENRGLIATLNEGLALAQGDLIARMDADDIAYPSRLSRQVAAFAQQPQCAICGSGVDTLVGARIVRGTADPIYQLCSLRILSMFFTIFIHSTVVYNRRVIPEKILRYDPRYVHAEDFDLFRRIADRFPATMIEDSLIAYRIHDGSVSSRHRREMRRTHLAIVTENLEREATAVVPGTLCDIGEAVTPDTVRRAADSILALEGWVATLPAETRPSYEQGTLNLFYFIYQLISDEQRPELTHEFLSRAQKWGLIRRREKYGLLVGAYAPWLSRVSTAATRRVDALSRHLQSVPAAAVLPRYHMS